MLPVVKNICAAAAQLVLYIYLFASLPHMQKPQSKKILFLVTSKLAKSCRGFPVGLCGRHLRHSMCQAFKVMS